MVVIIWTGHVPYVGDTEYFFSIQTEYSLVQHVFLLLSMSRCIHVSLVNGVDINFEGQPPQVQ